VSKTFALEDETRRGDGMGKPLPDMGNVVEAARGLVRAAEPGAEVGADGEDVERPNRPILLNWLSGFSVFVRLRMDSTAALPCWLIWLIEFVMGRERGDDDAGELRETDIPDGATGEVRASEDIAGELLGSGGRSFDMESGMGSGDRG